MVDALESRLFGAHAQDVRFVLAPIDEDAHFAFAEEADQVRGAVPARQREFATGRRLAHGLLARLGAPSTALLVRSDRAPEWPDGFTGSITHGDGRCAVALAPTATIEAIGIDLEDAGPLAADLVESIVTPAELARMTIAVTGEVGDDGVALARLAKRVFCAKEAVYKALARRVGRVLEFHEVEVDLTGDTFVARFEGRSIDGRFALDADSLLAAVVLRKGDDDALNRG